VNPARDDDRILECAKDMARQIQGDMGDILRKLNDGDYAGATADHRGLNETWNQLGCDLDWLRQRFPVDHNAEFGVRRRL
jgi:hypothetical protein